MKEIKRTENNQTDEATKVYQTVSEPKEKSEIFKVRKMTEDGGWETVRLKYTKKADIHLPVSWDTEYEEDDELEEFSEDEESVERQFRLPKINGKALKIGSAAAGIIIAAAAVFSVYVYKYPSVFPGVNIASEYKLGGLSRQQAEQLISKQCNLSGRKITVNAEGKNFDLDADRVVEYVDSQKSAENAYNVGRQGNYFQRAGGVLSAMFGGQSISLDMDMNDVELSGFVRAMAQKVETKPVQPSWKLDTENSQIIIDTGKDGMGFDHRQITDMLGDKLRMMDFSDLEISNSVKNPFPVNVHRIAREANCEMQNAHADPSTGELVESMYGIEVSEDAIKKAVGDGTEQTYKVPVKLTEPKMTTEQLKDVLFRDVLAQVTTNYNPWQTGRTTNVRLTAESCDNTILNPGDEFSYNTIVGERTAERGYQVATIFVDGTSVEDYGGGACQSSSTIYMAVLRADLKVTERRNHQFQISYTPISQDATVAWGSQDFKFVNDTDYPIKIDMSMDGGDLNCTIYGTKTDDKQVELYSTSYYGSDYRYATLYKTVTVNGQSETTTENESSYRIEKQTQSDEDNS